MAYFDNAATTFPKPEDVYSSMDTFYRSCGGSVGRGSHVHSHSAGTIVAETRSLIQEILHCPAKQVIFEPTATIALNIIIQGIILNGARCIYISPFEHNAVTRILHSFDAKGMINVEVLAVAADFTYDLDRIQAQFTHKKPDFVIISHVSNVIGLIAPIQELCTLAKQYGAATLVDMAQSAGLVDVDISHECYDFAVFAGHKTLYGPTGASGFVMKPSFELPSVFFGGTGYDSQNQDMPQSIPERYEFGTVNAMAIAGLNAALKWIRATTIDELWKRESMNRKKLLQLLEKYGFVHLVGVSKECTYTGIVSCLIDGISSDSAGTIFSEHNVAVRTGLQCAPFAHRRIGTFPAGTIRFSVSHFTNDEDFRVLKEALDYIEDNM